MATGQMEEIASTLLRVATPHLPRKQLLKGIKKAHPKTAKKEIAQSGLLRTYLHRTRSRRRQKSSTLLPSKSGPI